MINSQKELDRFFHIRGKACLAPTAYNRLETEFLAFLCYQTEFGNEENVGLKLVFTRIDYSMRTGLTQGQPLLYLSFLKLLSLFEYY
jgi:hypothetical protein